MTRQVFCDHVGGAVEPVEPFPRSKVVLGDVTMLLSLGLCALCTASMELGGSAIVGPQDGSGLRMSVNPATMTEIKRRQSGRRPEPTPERSEPQNVRTTRKVAGHSVVLFAEPRLQEREIASWSRRYAAGEVTAAAYKRILAAIMAGPEAPTGRRPNLAAADTRRTEQERLPHDAPKKADTKVRLKWNARIGFYDGNNPPVSQTMKAAMRGSKKR